MGFNIERVNKPFVVKSPYKPSGDQPKAIEELATRIENGENDVVLMGATGTGKTATTAWLIERLHRLIGQDAESSCGQPARHRSRRIGQPEHRLLQPP